LPPSRRHGRALLGALLSLAALAGCVWWASKQEAPTFPTSPSSLGEICAALAIYALITAVRGWRWHRILIWTGADHRDADAYGLTVVGYMGNTVLPARGGEVLRILLLSERSSVRRREALGTVLPERMLDAAALVLLFAVVSFLGTAGTPTGTAPAAIGLAALLVAVLALVVYLRLRIAGRFHAFAERVRPIARASRLLLTRLGVVLLAVSVLVWLAEATVFWLVLKSLSIDVSGPEALLIVLLASFFALVPAAPGYVGTFDAALLFGLGAAGIAGGAAIGGALLYRFVVFVPITVAGLGLMLARYGGLGRLRARNRPEQEPMLAGPPGQPR
jgi:glycosyltransferase 2 family protein